MKKQLMASINQKNAEDSHKMVCSKCNKVVNYNAKYVKIHYHIGYDCRTVQCTYCKRINIIGYEEQYGFDVNNDKRFYQYKFKKE